MIYTVVIHSGQAYNIATAPSNALTYVFDWSVLPQFKKYKLRFTFTSGLEDLLMDDIVQIVVDFTASPNTYEIDEINKNRRCASNQIGLAYPVYGYGAGNSRLYAGVNDNVPITLNDRPSNNMFTVKLYDLDDNPYATTIGYVLTLSFEEIE